MTCLILRAPSRLIGRICVRPSVPTFPGFFPGSSGFLFRKVPILSTHIVRIIGYYTGTNPGTWVLEYRKSGTQKNRRVPLVAGEYHTVSGGYPLGTLRVPKTGSASVPSTRRDGDTYCQVRTRTCVVIARDLKAPGA